MKKIMTTLFAMAAVFCASAATDLPTYTVDPASDSELAGKTQEITFTFSEPVKVDYVDFIGGQRFNAVTTRVATGMTAPSTTLTVNAIDSYWGDATGGEFLLEVYLPAIYNAAGEQLMETGTDPDTQKEYSYPYTAVSYYSTPDTTPVSFLRYEPGSDEMTVWDVYMDGWGSVIFVFSGEVQMTNENATATVTYVIDGETIRTTVPASEIWADWNMWTGEYELTVMLPANEDATQEDLTSIKVEIRGISANDTAISVPSAEYTLMSLPSMLNRTKKQNNTAGIQSVELNEGTDAIYNMQGVRVNASSIKDLTPGLYIVNGRKISVK